MTGNGNANLTLVTDHAHDTRQLVANAGRAYRVDQLTPDHRESALAAERYLDDADDYGVAEEARLAQWRRGGQGTWMSPGWLKAFKRRG